MDYKKAYKDALERARELKNKLEKSCSLATPIAIESIFPELKESEDEKIRKELLAWLKSTDGQTLPIDRFNAAIAWLEKQGEPQPYRGNADTMRKNLIKAFKSVGSNHWGGFDVRDIIHFLESKDAIELEKQGEQNNIVEQLTAFAQHLNKRGAFRDDLYMDFEHEAQSFIEMQNNKEL